MSEGTLKLNFREYQPTPRILSNVQKVRTIPKETTHDFGATGAGGNPCSTASHWGSSISLEALNRSPQWTSVQLGPQPTRKERPMKSPMSISNFPLPRVMDCSRGTRPCCLRTPTVFTCTSGTSGGTENAGANGEVDSQRAADGGLLQGLTPFRSCGAVLGDWKMALANLDCSSPPAGGKKNTEVSGVLASQPYIPGILRGF